MCLQISGPTLELTRQTITRRGVRKRLPRVLKDLWAMPVSAPGLINLTSVRDGRLRTNIRKLAVLDEAVAAFNPTKRIKGKDS